MSQSRKMKTGKVTRGGTCREANEPREENEKKPVSQRRKMRRGK
jgi:hypothetical protein